MAPAWNTDRSLLNPRFESYKLSTGTLSYATSSLLSSEPCGRVLQGSSTDEEPTLGWREAHFRASFNHLFPVEEGLAWIDAAGRMWAASKGNLGNVRLAGRIPLPRSEAKQQQQQWGLYASIVQVSGKWIVSDGWGTLHLFDYANSQIQYSASLSTPFNLHAAHQTPDLNVLLLLSHPTPKDKATTGDRIRLLCVTFHLDQPTLQVLHTFKGDQYPVYASIGHDGQATIAAASPFVNVTQPASQPEEAVTLPESVQTTALKIPAFSWTQGVFYGSSECR